MNISKRDLKLLLLLLGILIFIGTYVFVYNHFNDQTTSIESDITTLTPRLEQLQGYYNNLSTYQEGIESCKTDLASGMSSYPNDVRSEDAIMYAVNLEKEIGVTISSASFGDAVSLMSIRGVVSNEDGSYTITPFNANYKAITYSFNLSYQQLKNTINYINRTANCTKLDNVSISYDSETGELNGSITVNKYYITGADTLYHATDVPSVSIGTDNIFHTITTH